MRWKNDMDEVDAVVTAAVIIVAVVLLLSLPVYSYFQELSDKREVARQADRELTEKIGVRDARDGITLDALPTDSFGYAIVKQDQNILFPVIGYGEDSAILTDKDLFEIVSVLGDPSDQNSRMTEFDKGELWFVVRNCASSTPQFFILVLRFPSPAVFTKQWPQSLEDDYLVGRFRDKTGYPITSPASRYIYVENVQRGLRAVVVNQAIANEQGIYARTFTGESTGRLVVIIRAPLPSDAGTDSDLRVYIVERAAVKLRSDLNDVLPNPATDWLNQSFINWEDGAETPVLNP